MAAPPPASLFGMAPFLWPCGFRVFGSMQAWAGREKARGFKALQCNQPVPKINSLFWFFFSFFLPLSVLLFFYFFFFFLLCVSSVSDRYKQKHNSKPADSGTWTCRLPLLFAWPMLLLLSLVWFALMILICFKLPPPKKVARLCLTSCSLLCSPTDKTCMPLTSLMLESFWQIPSLADASANCLRNAMALLSLSVVLLDCWGFEAIALESQCCVVTHDHLFQWGILGKPSHAVALHAVALACLLTA